MFAPIARLPLAVTLLGVGGLAMLVPATHAAAVGAAPVAWIFVSHAGLTLLAALLIGIAMANRVPGELPARHLAGLLVLFVAMPFLFALPFKQALGNTTMFNAYVEMVSDLTTTGAPLFDEPGRLSAPLHTWRATVGWLGGLFIWIGAIAVLAPMALGGFEVRRRVASEDVVARDFAQITERADLSHRIRVHAAELLPIYSMLTLLLWGGLVLAGDSPSVALAHAMSTLSTSGISPVGGLSGGGAGWAGEALVAGFLVFAISRLTFDRDGRHLDVAALRRDPEIRLAAVIVAVVSVFLFLRHFVGAYEVSGAEMSLWQGIGALWGAVFTALSFLTTAGWQSAAWSASQDWSGLNAPSLILFGLALIGGGVATTAGGAKLLRVYALYQHGKRELNRLVYPHSVAGAGGEARHVRRRGAYAAWLFFMLMALSASLVLLAFALAGESFNDALVLTIAALTTTGPLASVAGPDPISYGALGTAAKAVLAAAMVLGRLETLAIAALLSPDLWRR